MVHHDPLPTIIVNLGLVKLVFSQSGRLSRTEEMSSLVWWYMMIPFGNDELSNLKPWRVPNLAHPTLKSPSSKVFGCPVWWPCGKSRMMESSSRPPSEEKYKNSRTAAAAGRLPMQTMMGSIHLVGSVQGTTRSTWVSMNCEKKLKKQSCVPSWSLSVFVFVGLLFCGNTDRVHLYYVNVFVWFTIMQQWVVWSSCENANLKTWNNVLWVGLPWGWNTRFVH